jgi:hypothetical protein
VPARPTSSAEDVTIIRVAGTKKRLVRRVALHDVRSASKPTEQRGPAEEASSSTETTEQGGPTEEAGSSTETTEQGGPAEEVRNPIIATDQGTLPKPRTRRRSRLIRTVKVQPKLVRTIISKSDTPGGRFSADGGRSVPTAGTVTTNPEFVPVNQQLQTVRFMKAPIQPTTPSSTKDHPQGVHIRRMTSINHHLPSNLSKLTALRALDKPLTRREKGDILYKKQLRTESAGKPLRPDDAGPFVLQQRDKVITAVVRASKAQRQLKQKRGESGLRKSTTRVPLVFRKLYVETDLAFDYTQQHVRRNITRALIRKIAFDKPPVIRMVKRDSPITGGRPRLRRVRPFTIRKHLSISPDSDRVEAIRLGILNGGSKDMSPDGGDIAAVRERGLEMLESTQLESQELQSPQPLKIVEHGSFRLRKHIAAEPKFSIKTHLSSPPYPLPTNETREFFKQFVEPRPPQNLDDENPAERIDRIVESSSAKRIQRESWLARKGDLRLAISLLLSDRSMTYVKKLRSKYNSNLDQFGHFRILRQLNVGQYMEYERMLFRFARDSKPFSIAINSAVFHEEKSRYRVGMHLEFEKLEKLEKDLLGCAGQIIGRGDVDRRNTRDNEELGMMIIDGKIKTYEEAWELVQRLDMESLKGIANIRVDGLILHGYTQGGDTLFPPPKEFLFSKERRRTRSVTDLSFGLPQAEIEANARSRRLHNVL